MAQTRATNRASILRSWRLALAPGLQLFHLSQPSRVCAFKRYTLCIPTLPTRHPNLSMPSFKPHLESRCNPPFSLIPHCTARRPKNLQRPTKRRHRASPGDKGVDSPSPMSSGPGHFIPQIDTLGAISYELFSAGLWPRWGPEPRFCRGSGLSQLRVTEMWDETRNLLPGPEPRAPLFRSPALLSYPRHLQSFYGFTAPRPSWASRSSSCQAQASKNPTRPSPLQLPRAHPVFVESVLVQLSEVYLKGHLRAGEDTPLLAPARTTGSAVGGSQFFPLGAGGRFCTESAKPRGEAAPDPMAAPASETPAGARGRDGNGSPGGARPGAPGEGEERAGLQARRAEGKRKARDGR